MKAENNKFPYLTIEQAAEPALPDAGCFRIFVDVSDGGLKVIDSAGLVSELGGTDDASTVAFTPAGSIAATNVQAAIEEVAAEAAAGGGGVSMAATRDVCSTVTAITTTTADMPGLSRDVTVAGTSSAYLVIVSLDVNGTGGGAHFIGTLTVNGTAQTTEMIYRSGSAGRTVLAQTFLVTGLAAGTSSFKVRARQDAGASFTLNANHSAMVILRVA